MSFYFEGHYNLVGMALSKFNNHLPRFTLVGQWSPPASALTCQVHGFIYNNKHFCQDSIWWALGKWQGPNGRHHHRQETLIQSASYRVRVLLIHCRCSFASDDKVFFSVSFVVAVSNRNMDFECGWRWFYLMAYHPVERICLMADQIVNQWNRDRHGIMIHIGFRDTLLSPWDV